MRGATSASTTTRSSPDDPKIRFYAGCPIRLPDGNKIGTLCVIDMKPRTLDTDEREILLDLARMAEQEIAAVQLATMDELTLLSNRRGFLALGQHALGLCSRLARPASLLFFDLDAFKAINDRHGHAEGDRALVAFGGLLLDNFRESDVVGRLGGDEFVVLLVNMAPGESRVALDRLQRAVDEVNRRSGAAYSLRFSVGHVDFDPQQHRTIDVLLGEADQRMYERKQGKGQAAPSDAVAEGSQPPAPAPSQRRSLRLDARLLDDLRVARLLVAEERHRLVGGADVDDVALLGHRFLDRRIVEGGDDRGVDALHVGRRQALRTDHARTRLRPRSRAGPARRRSGSSARGRHALRRGDADRAQRAALQVLLHARQRGGGEVDLAADQVGDHRAHALVRDVLGLDAGLVEEHLGRQVQDGAVAARARSSCSPVLRLQQRDQLLRVAGRHLGGLTTSTIGV